NNMESLFVLPVDQYYDESANSQASEEIENFELDSDKDSNDLGICEDLLKYHSKNSRCSISSNDVDLFDDETEMSSRYTSSSSIMSLLQDSTPKFTNILKDDWKSGISTQKSNLKTSFTQNVQKMNAMLVTSYMMKMKTLQMN